MNVDIVGRIRPTLHGESVFNLEVDSKNRLVTGPGGNYFSFLTLYKQDTTNFELYKKAVDPLLELFIAGYNVSLFFTGETGSGKTYSLAGESSSKSGITPIVLEHLFQRVKVDDQYMYDNKLSVPTQVNIQMFEVFSDQVRDLLTIPKSASEFCELDESAESGVFVKSATTMPLRNASDAATVFRQGWGRRSVSYTDFGPANNYTAVVLRLDLELQGREDPFPHKSRFTFVELPGLEKLSEDTTEMRLREGPSLNKGLLSFSETIARIAAHPAADRVVNYSGSKLTHLLKEELGGNCKTRILLCLKPNTDGRVLNVLFKYSEQISRIRNFPIRNDTFTQNLITQYRAEILDLKRQLGLSINQGDVGAVRDQIRKLQTENLMLKDKNERLHYRLDQVQNKFGHMAQTKTDLSGQLLMTEEEKLKVSKTLVDMQIENNRLLEELERAKFELTNKIIRLESEKMDKDSSKDKFRKMAENAREKLEEIERDRKDLADEYVTLKTNYLSLTQDHKVMSAKLDDLCMELLNLVNAKVILMKQVVNLEKTYGAIGEPLSRDFGHPEREVDRIKSMIEKISSKKFDASLFKAREQEREEVERHLFGNNQRFEGEIDKMKNQYEDQQTKLNFRITELNQELIELRKLSRDRQQRISELNAQLITAKSDNDNMRHENNRLQTKMKELNDEYKSRLNKWVEDIADYVDAGTGLPGKKTSPEKYKEFVENMLKDIKKAHKFRETQLSEAATNFRQKSINVTKKHEQLLVAYNNLRQEVQRRKDPDIDVGPDDAHLLITDDELTTYNQKEVARLKDALARAEAELDGLRITKSMPQSKEDGGGVSPRLGVSPGVIQPGSKWNNLRKQLREFTMNTQQELESERAELLTENMMLKEQLAESQEYIDIHLITYKEEIFRLRKMLGMDTRNISRLGR